MIKFYGLIFRTPLRNERVFPFLLLASMIIGCQQDVDYEISVMKGDFWKDQAVEDILPYWTELARDTSNGAFRTYLDKEWKPTTDSRKYPSMISRHVFSYAAAYLMTGKKEYIDIARETKDFLIARGWDREFGGWFDELDEEGNPLLETKSMFVQVYVITGLSMYYFVTHDQEVLGYILQSNHLLESRAWDHENWGYFNVMSRDWTIADSRKTFAAQVAPVSGYLLSLYLATRKSIFLEQSKKIMEVVLENMGDPEQGWILENFDASWNYLPGNPDQVNIGHNLEVAWMLMRLTLLEEDPVWLEKARIISTLLDRWGYDDDMGFWYATVGRENPGNHSDFTHWWIQAYGNMYSLYRYRTTKKESVLTTFIEGAESWNKYFIDREWGGTWLSVNTDGTVRDPSKANRFKSSYHSLEHSLLNFIYLQAWVEYEPFELYFSIEAQPEPGILFPVPVEDPGVVIEQVKFNDEIRNDVTRHDDNALVLPAGEKILVNVTLGRDR